MHELPLSLTVDSSKKCVALRADVFEALVSLVSCLRDFLVKFQV